MKKAKDNIEDSDEHQTVSSSWECRLENLHLRAQLDFLLSSIRDGCSPAEAKFLRQMNHRFITEMGEKQAKVDELLK